MVIKAERTSSCDSCASRETCATGSGKDMFIEAENTLGVKTGDRVIFTIGKGSVVKAGLLLYLFPVISFIVGVVLGATVGKSLLPSQNPDLVSGLTGVAFLVIAFIGLKIYSRALARKSSFRPQVLRVV